MINNFFDCLNVTSTTGAIKKGITFFNLKTQLSTTQPNVGDQRLQWLGNTFLNYLNEGKENIAARRGNFTKTEKAQMFISWLACEGFQITFKSIPECVSLLLTEGMEFILLKVSARILWRNTLAVYAKLGAGQKIQIYLYSDTTITLYASNAMFNILQATYMVGMMGSLAGKISLMMLFQNVNLKARH